MPAVAEFVVELPIFSGPFSLLADLILDQKVDICDVPVARVTDAFLNRGASELAGWSLEEVTWFLAICAVLVEVKVGRLLPRPFADTEEDLLGGASPDLVYARSRELAAFRTLSARIEELMEKASLRLARTAGPPPELLHLYPDVMHRVSGEALRKVALKILAPAPPIDLTHVAPLRVSVNEALDVVEGLLTLAGRASFRDLLEGCDDRLEVVVRFLAVLELYRRGQIDLSQAHIFGEIQVTWHPGGPLGSAGPVGGLSAAAGSSQRYGVSP